MKEFKEIVEVLKDIVSERDHGNGKVLDKHIASLLGISSTQLATCKSRNSKDGNSMPYKEIAEFCAKNRIALNSLLFDQLPESLVGPTNAMYTNRYNVAG